VDANSASALVALAVTDPIFQSAKLYGLMPASIEVSTMLVVCLYVIRGSINDNIVKLYEHLSGPETYMVEWTNQEMREHAVSRSTSQEWEFTRLGFSGRGGGGRRHVAPTIVPASSRSTSGSQSWLCAAHVRGVGGGGAACAGRGGSTARAHGRGAAVLPRQWGRGQLP
jgi:hypothetical protein